MNILKKLDWLQDTVKDLESEDKDRAHVSLQALKFYAVDIAKALLEAVYTPDTVVQEVMSKLVGRSRVGMKTYKIGMDENPLPAGEWIDHAVEELLDASNYLVRLKQGL